MVYINKMIKMLEIIILIFPAFLKSFGPVDKPDKNIKFSIVSGSMTGHQDK